MSAAPGRPASRRRGLAAPLALPAGFAGLLVVGALAAATGGVVDATWVLILAAVIVAAGSLVAEPAVAPLLGAIGWLTVVGFSRAPYAQLHVTGPVAVRAAITMCGCCLAGAAAGAGVRRIASSVTLWIVDVPDDGRPPLEAAGSPDPAAAPAAAPRAPGPAAARRRWTRAISGLSGGRCSRWRWWPGSMG
jgi:hypothetical protein